MGSLLLSIKAMEETKDVTLTVKGDERNVKAHRAILMTCSGYFEKMFDGAFLEKDSGTVTLSGLSFEVLQCLLDFIYSEKLIIPKSLAPVDVLLATDYLQMPGPLPELNKKIMAGINKFNVLLFWKYRQMMGDISQISTLRTLILTDFKDIIMDISFLETDFETVKWILESDQLIVDSETVVWNAIKMWINHDHESRNKHFPELLNCMRYDKSISVQFIMLDVLPNCKCTETLDYVISYLAYHNDYSGELDIKTQPRSK